LVACDLDGTLLRSDRTVSERNRRALRRAVEAGLVVVMVTSRAPYSVRRFVDAAGVSGLAICSNGAIVYDLDRDEIVRHTPLDVEIAKRLVLALRDAVPGVCFAFTQGARFACEPAYRPLAREADHDPGMLARAILGDALALCAEGPSKLIARHPSLTPDELLVQVQRLGTDGYEVTHSGAPFVEVAAAGVTKAWALEALCTDLGIMAQEVVAFGDAPNDLPMLRWAGRGVAMANAFPVVLAEAREIAPSNDDDGVADVLERLLDSADQVGGA
jgi:HAD superfamily hydrolase (TIGR01484 family)